MENIKLSLCKNLHYANTRMKQKMCFIDLKVEICLSECTRMEEKKKVVHYIWFKFNLSLTHILN